MVGKREERPRFGRFAYFEKFDYWAVFWGCAIFLFSGLAMWFPGMVSHLTGTVSPALFDALKEAHAHEAVLAFLAIAIWHVYNVHLRPGRFPGALTFLHGRISRRERLAEHPLESV
jgi:cytochrome b subunit of formate dehydrogenase